MKCEDCGDKVASDCWCQAGKPVMKTDEYGTKYWYLNGKYHREDGPAIEYSDGSKYWWLNGKRHREDGPAYEGAGGTKYWYLNGQEVTEEEVMGKKSQDNVNSPSHYNQAGIECIDAIKASLGDGYQDYCKGNVMKYLWRYKYKNGIEDLKKAQWYLNSMVESVLENNG
tara:strand:- start:207 stop:713 length:507 start_codon:yes stop_codon:yes gene_type:complete